MIAVRLAELLLVSVVFVVVSLIMIVVIFGPMSFFMCYARAEEFLFKRIGHWSEK